MPEWCHDESCQAEVDLSLEEACAIGWDLVEEFTYCPLHRQEAARRALAAAETKRIRARIEELRSERHKEEAKTGLSAAEYRAWDEFQSDMVNFHRKNGKLAPVQLRLLPPKKFAEIYAKKGRIDVEGEAEELFRVEQSAQRTRDWLMSRL